MKGGLGAESMCRCLSGVVVHVGAGGVQLLGSKSTAKPPASGDVKILEAGQSLSFDDFETGLAAIKKSLVSMGEGLELGPALCTSCLLRPRCRPVPFPFWACIAYNARCLLVVLIYAA